MEGKILGLNHNEERGVIKVASGNRYGFIFSEWQPSFPPEVNMSVDFAVNESGSAIEVYALSKPAEQKYINIFKKEKSKTAITLLAFFLGCLGAHKFYVGAYGWGIIYFFCFWFFPWAVLLVVIIETVRYICMSNEEFQYNYKSMDDSPFGII